MNRRVSTRITWGITRVVYAPSTTFAGGELYFTRLRKGSLSSEICVSVRVPKRLAIEGDAVEAPTLTRDGARMYYHRKLKSDGRYHVFTMTRRAAAQAHDATALQ